MTRLTGAALDRAVANAMGLKSVNNCEQWGEEHMSAKPIPAKDVATQIWKIIEDVANEYPEKEREELKAVLLGQLGMAMFNGPVVAKEKK